MSKHNENSGFAVVVCFMSLCFNKFSDHRDTGKTLYETGDFD